MLAIGLPVFSGCAGAGQAPTSVPPPTDVVATLYLMGDAGEPDPAGEPVLLALADDINSAAQGIEKLVVFLGDNLYPAGMPPIGPGLERDRDRVEAERRALAQVEVALSTRVPSLFVPGNHDWLAEGGWEGVLRQEEFVEAAGQGLVEWSPHGGCPGPAVRDLVNPVRLVVLDTQWWLQADERPPPSSCAANSEGEILARLRGAIQGAGQRHVIVVAHHPLLTGGPHGGHFTLGQHLFPLRDWQPWLWVPLPIIGSLYPIARMLGINDQDTAGGENRRMTEALRSAMSTDPPLVYASGHSHTLEVVDGRTAAGVLLVSGAGIFGHTSPTAELDETLYRASERAGYMRLDFERGGRVRVAVVVVDADAGRQEAFSMYLEDPR